MFDLNNLEKEMFNNVSEEVFEDALKHYDIFFNDYLSHDSFPFQDEETDFVIYVGDITTHIDITNYSNLLVIGNVNLDTINFKKVEYKTFQVTGNVTCNYFNYGYELFTVIGGNLTVNKIFNLSYEDSDIIIKGTLDVDFINGEALTVGGDINVNYGIMGVEPIGFWNLSNEEKIKVKQDPKYDPKHTYEESENYIGIKDFDRENLEKLIEEKTK